MPTSLWFVFFILYEFQELNKCQIIECLNTTSTILIIFIPVFKYNFNSICIDLICEFWTLLKEILLNCKCYKPCGYCYCELQLSWTGKSKLRQRGTFTFQPVFHVTQLLGCLTWSLNIYSRAFLKQFCASFLNQVSIFSTMKTRWAIKIRTFF